MKFYLDVEDFQDKLNCSIGVAILTAAGLGAASSIYAAGEAGDAQRDAAQMGVDAQQRNFNQIRSDFTPYRVAGENALTDLNARLPELTAPIKLTQDWLESTPGYQFTKTQGLKSVQNSAAARGLGVSGAALKGAASFATGLADNTYKTQFDVENTNKTNAYNRLKGLVDTGQASSAQTANAGMNAANQSQAAYTQAGTATAAQYNAQGGAIANAANTIGGYAAYKGLYGGQGGMTPAGYSSLGNAWYNN